MTYTIAAAIPDPLNHCAGPQQLLEPLQLKLGFFFFFFVILGLHLWLMEIPRLGVQLELQLQAYSAATATQDLSHVCDLHHSLWQCQILNPLSEARDQICNLMGISHVFNPLSHNGNSLWLIFFFFFFFAF